MVTCANGWTLRARQEECHDKLIEAYKNGEKDFFIVAVCRFGKTLTTTVTLRDLGNIIDPENQAVVILSTMNVKSEWYSGAEKAGFSTDLIGTSKDEMIDINSVDFSLLSRKGKHIVYVSTQKLGNGSRTSEDLIEWFNQHKGLKTLVYDECHLGSGTDRTKNVIERLDYDNRVYLSATPYRRHLKAEFHLDREVGEKICYKYSLSDEKKDYVSGLITDYTPVQLQMHILDYKSHMESMIDEDSRDFNTFHSVSSAYFKKLFTDSAYEERAVEFLNRIIEFSEDHNIHNWLFYVPLNKVGNDLVRNFSKKFKDKITFLNVSGDYSSEAEESDAWTQDVRGLNNLYALRDNTIKIGITCNKCGTGATIPDLEAVAFLKDTSQAISFIQKSQRPRTPVEGKSVGYVLCFNSFEGLEAYKNYVIAETQTNDDTADRQRKFEDKYEEFKNNNVVELYLDLKKIDNYEDLIDIENTYIPGRYPLFDDFDFDLFTEDDLVFLTSVAQMKKKFANGKKFSGLRADPEYQDAATRSQLSDALRKHGHDKEADDLDAEDAPLTTDDCRRILEYYYVSAIRTFHSLHKTPEEILDVSTYLDEEWLMLKLQFRSKVVWSHIIENYPRYVNMVYNFLNKGFEV